MIWPDNDTAGFKAATDIGKELRLIGVNSLKVISHEMIKDLPPKWDLADPIPNTKAKEFISDCLLRAESRAIGIERLSSIACQNGLTFEQLNRIVCAIDDRLRLDLEKKYGSKTWEIEAIIMAETNKDLQEKYLPLVANILPDKTPQKESVSRSVGMSPSEQQPSTYGWIKRKL